MFWGWYSFDNGPRSSGCFFLPFLCVCGSPFLFTGFNSRFLLPLILVAILGWMIPAIFNQGARRQAYNEDSELLDGEKPKRDTAEKPKRTDEYNGDNDEPFEVIDAPQ